MILSVERGAAEGPPWLHTAISWALLQRTAAGLEGETLRLFRPARVLAFGPADRLASGFEDARAAARAQGFAPVDRLAGGRAAVFHEQTIAFAWTVPDAQARAGIRARFEVMSALLAEALRAVGVDAHVGAVPGEYCPGDYSVNARGRTKIMGVGQRVLPAAAHVGGVIVVDGAEAIRDVLLPVNAALGLEWDATTVGAVRDEVPGATWDGVVDAIVEAARARFAIETGDVSATAVRDAYGLEERFADPGAIDGAALLGRRVAR